MTHSYNLRGPQSGAGRPCVFPFKLDYIPYTAHGCIVEYGREVRKYIFLFYQNSGFQPWCAPEPGVNWAYCGPDCPIHPLALEPITDDNLEVTPHYDQEEIMMTLKLFGIMASSLLLLYMMVTCLGN